MRGVRRAARRTVGLLATVALVVTVAGCTGGGREPEKTDDVFSVAIGEPTHLIPGNCQEGNGIAVISGLFENLVSLQPNGELVHAAAKSITSEDQRVWTIELRPGRTFHNGEKVTSASFVDAWSAAAYAPNKWVNNYFFANIEGYEALNPANGKPKTKKLSGLDIINDTTFKVTLDAPFSQFPLTLAYTGFAPLPKKAFDDFAAFDEKPIGNGPFRMAGSWQHDRSIKLTAYDGYKGRNRPAAGGVDFRIYSDRQTAYNDVIGGNVDIYDEVPAAQLPTAKKSLGGRFFTEPSSDFHYLGFPIYDERFADPKVRRAISMAIDRKQIIDEIYHGSFRPADSLISPIVPGYRKGACGKACEYHPAEAKRLLREAGGWKGTMTLWFASDTYEDGELKAIAQQLRENLGIDKVTLRRQLFSAYLENLAGHGVTGPYRLDWGMDYPSPQNYLEPLYSTDGSSNRIGYSDTEVDELIERGNRAPSVDAGVTFYNRAEDRVLADMPVAPLYFGQIQVGHSQRVSNVEVDALVGIHLWDVKVRK